MNDMNNSIYGQLQQNFIKVRYLFSENNYDEDLLKETIEDIEKIRDKLLKRKKQERRLMLYCVDTLLEIIADNNKIKIREFADTIQNMPDIALGKRNIYSFDKEILRFQNKYGKKYFPDFDKAKPKFQKKAPKNKWEFFRKKSDESFKRLHPIGYYVLITVGLVALMLPVFPFVAYVEYINPVKNDMWILVGFVGTFAIGVGLFNIVAAWIHQYLGHLLTLICFFGGSILTALSLFMLYC